MRSINPISLSALALLVAALHGSAVRAEVRLQGPADAIQLEAHDATVAEILEALHARFDMSFRGPVPSRQISGTYDGPIRHILSRVLDGYNYMIVSHGATIEAVMLGAESVGQSPAQPAAIPHRRAD